MSHLFSSNHFKPSNERFKAASLNVFGRVLKHNEQLDKIPKEDFERFMSEYLGGKVTVNLVVEHKDFQDNTDFYIDYYLDYSLNAF